MLMLTWLTIGMPSPVGYPYDWWPSIIVHNERSV
jgi:hypothetical protein